MATRSMYGILNSDNSVTAVYCHWDGYPAGVGECLKTFYNTEDKVRELISKGGASSIGDTLSGCSFYVDRGETLEIDNYVSEHDYLTNNGKGVEWCYTFNPKENSWNHKKV